MTFIFDFDGTLTDPFPHADAMREAMINILVSRGIPERRVMRDIEVLTDGILGQPEEHPWVVGGIPACFGNEDPFVVNNVTAQELFETNEIYRGLFESPGQLSAEAYRGATRDMPPHFRDDTPSVLKEIIRDGNRVCVVTNAGTDKVRRMLGEIGVSIPIYGDAEKFMVDMEWDKVPRTLEIGDRCIFLRRAKYFNILREMGSEKMVIGDVFSMDLSLPHAIGIPIVLVKTPYTPSWAERFVEKNGRVVKSLLEVLD
ncbi:hypothetical protein CH333_10485 [candidate division WOR-3 bacterium JGI_Cruoil_03_44_89]|uniref:HAD family hydrolase n=1 Tax=candidate division WOR-3 bacterium JGI_Cruoil_03_44_89 TaxID=1973748 RepID=A0A235BN69_UNCW3|nr:MAG: hypothetical protein CH333_10485 [candidate division WOR-3 bacterium JGI_Cruoil_03_44_89]